jgi:hypothetical protein
LPDHPAGSATINSPVRPPTVASTGHVGMNAEENLTSQTVTFTRTSSGSIEEGEEGERHGDLESWMDDEGYESPIPVDDRVAELRNERRYRLLLAHDFHPSRKLSRLFSL